MTKNEKVSVVKAIQSQPCGYCNTPADQTVIKLRLGNKMYLAKASKDAIKGIETAAQQKKGYWIALCPACGSIVGVTYEK